jgi:hypothetical protein
MEWDPDGDDCDVVKIYEAFPSRNNRNNRDTDHMG